MKTTREPVSTSVGTPGIDAAAGGGAAAVASYRGFGRQAELASGGIDIEHGPTPTSPGPFADPDPFRSTPASVAPRSNPSSADGHVRLSSDLGHSTASHQTSYRTPHTPVSTAHAATLPFSVALPAPGVPIMKPMQPVMPESHPPSWAGSPISSPPMARNPLPPLQVPQARPDPQLFTSRHRTNPVNPFDDANSISRSFDSTGQSSFLSSGASVYSDDMTDTATDDGIPRPANRRDRELHASDLFVRRSEDERNSRAMSGTGFAL